MKTKKTLVLTIATIVICACNNNTGTFSNEKMITVDSLNIETIFVDSIENCSYTGFSGVRGDSIYYLDRVLSYLYTISEDGHVGFRELGLGKSSNELPLKYSMQVSYDDEGESFDFMGGSYDMYIYSKDQKTSRVDMKPAGDKNSYSSSTAYTLWDEVIMESDKDYIYYNILGNNEKVDIFHRDDYLEKAAIIMRVSKKNGEMAPIGRYSDYYAANKSKLKHLPYYYFDKDGDGGFYVTYQADSTIYHYDKDFNVIARFGIQGRDMCVDYSNPGTTLESFVEAYQSDKGKVGRYYWIKKCGDYVFRSYFKSKEADTDGLQIYKDNVLIGDVDVPHGFRVAGKCENYWVTTLSFNNEPEQMHFYRFKID